MDGRLTRERRRGEEEAKGGRVFDKYDEDGDGQITLDELRNLLSDYDVEESAQDKYVRRHEDDGYIGRQAFIQGLWNQVLIWGPSETIHVKDDSVEDSCIPSRPWDRGT